METTKDLKFKATEGVKNAHKKYKNVKSRKQGHKELFKKSIKQSKKDLLGDIKKLKRRPSTTNFLLLIRDLVNSAHWVGSSYFRYKSSTVNISKYKQKEDTDEEEQLIIDGVSHSSCDLEYTDEEIFRAIYTDLERERQFLHYESKLTVPQTKNLTIVLISGVFNEIFTTAAFERGVEYISKKIGASYTIPDVSGVKGHRHNENIIKSKLVKYIDDFPERKLWILAYSKGGVDSLYFLRKNKDFASKYIVGLSVIASPIMGTNHFNNRLIMAVKNTEMAQELFHLDTKVRDDWLKTNHKYLPKNMFYSSLAFEANWYESHFTMMLAKLALRIDDANDGMVEVANAHFPKYFESLNLGTLKGHHLAGARSSSYSQESLLKAISIFLRYKSLI